MFKFAKAPNALVTKFEVGPSMMHAQPPGIEKWNEECKLDPQSQKMRREGEREFVELLGGKKDLVGKSVEDSEDGVHVFRAICATHMAELLLGSIIRKNGETTIAIPDNCTFARTVTRRAKAVNASVWNPTAQWGERLMPDEGPGKELIEGIGNSRWNAVVLLTNLTSRGEVNQLVNPALKANMQAEHPADIFLDAVSDDLYRLAREEYLNGKYGHTVSAIFTGVQKFTGGGTEGSGAVATNRFMDRVLRIDNKHNNQSGIVSAEAQYRDSVANMPSYTPDLCFDAWLGYVCQTLNNRHFREGFLRSQKELMDLMDTRMRDNGDLHQLGISLPVPPEYASSVTPLIHFDELAVAQVRQFLKERDLSVSQLPPGKMDDRLTDDLRNRFLRMAFFTSHHALVHRFKDALDAFHECATSAQRNI